MTNIFLKVNKDLFGIGLTPIQILIIAQILEFQTKEKECFISNKELAKNYGMSESTVDRAIGELVKKAIIIRKTKNTQTGRVRYLCVNEVAIDALRKQQNEVSANSKMTISKPQNEVSANVKLTFSKQQNDSIKDNIKDKLKGLEEQPSAGSPSLGEEPEGKEEKVAPTPDGTQENPLLAEKAWLLERYNELYECNGLFRYKGNYYRMI